MEINGVARLYKLTTEINLPALELANYLLGKVLVRNFDNKLLKGRIVETECYLGTDDKASQTYNGRRTTNNEPLYMPAGTSYVYMTYGIYHCLNISAAEPGGAVLIRALEPLEGVEHMRSFRREKRSKNSKELWDTELCNGPSKLCIAMNINKIRCNNVNMCESDEFYLENDPEYDDSGMQIVKAKRIGIDKVEKEWALKPFRFYIYNNEFVSKKDKAAEAEFS